MSNPVAGIDLEARLDGFRKELKLAREAGGAEFKALAQDIDKSLRQATAAAKRTSADTKRATREASDALRTTATAGRDLGGVFGIVGGAAKKLAGSFGLVSTDAASMARAVDDVADVGEVASNISREFGVNLGSILRVAGPVALAVAALSMAWSHYEEEFRKAEAKQKQSADILDDTRSLTDKVAESKRKLAKELGGETALQAESEEIEIRWNKAAQESNKTLEERRRALATELAANKAAGSFRLEEVQRREELAAGLAAVSRQIRANVAASEVGAQTDRDSAEAARLRAEAEDHVAENIKKATEASKEAAALVPFDQQVAELRAKLASDQASRQEAIDTKTREDAEAGAKILADIEADRTESYIKESEKRLAEAERAAQEEKRIAEQTAQAYGDLFGALSSIASSARSNMTEEQKEAAKTLFAVEKGLGLAEAAINAYLGISEAAASAPPPYNAIPIAAATVQGAANLAAIAAVPPPSFGDTPGVMKMQRGGTVQLAQDDVFAAAQTPEKLRQQVGGGSQRVVLQLNHRPYDDLIREKLLQNGPLPKAIRGTTRVGHRERS